MINRVIIVGVLSAFMVLSQTQIDLNRQVRNSLPYSSGGTSASTQGAARLNVGSPALVATDFAGTDLGQQVNNAFASFGSNKCGTVVIPAGTYVYSTEIVVPSTCTLAGQGRANDAPGNDATELIYDGPPATSAVSLGDASQATVRDLFITSNLSSTCPNAGFLRWNPAASGSNKWQCYDGTTYSAPVVHLAGVRFGVLDPTAISTGTFNSFRNIDVSGGGTNWPTSQGAFNFGFLINGCQSCTVQSTNVAGAHIGYLLGDATNGMLLNQATARINRRAGMQYHGVNAVLCNMCLLESNSWFGQTPDPTAYGVGLLTGDDIYGAGIGFEMAQGYFEANWVDVANLHSTDSAALVANGFQSLRGRFSSVSNLATTKFTECVIPDGSLVTVSGMVVNGCNTTGTLVKDNASLYVTTDLSGTLVTEFWRRDTGGVSPTHKWYELLTDGNNSIVLRDQRTNSFVTRLVLANSDEAISTANADSATLRFEGKRWTGSSTGFSWNVRASASQTNGAAEALENLHFIHGGANGTRYVTFRKDPSGPFSAIVRGDASQGSGNLFEWQDSGQNILSRIRADGAFQTQPSGAKPTCNAGSRFTFWTTAGSSGVKDTVEVCAKDAADNYAWRAIY